MLGSKLLLRSPLNYQRRRSTLAEHVPAKAWRPGLLPSGHKSGHPCQVVRWPGSPSNMELAPCRSSSTHSQLDTQHTGKPHLSAVATVPCGQAQVYAAALPASRSLSQIKPGALWQLGMETPPKQVSRGTWSLCESLGAVSSGTPHLPCPCPHASRFASSYHDRHVTRWAKGQA